MFFLHNHLPHLGHMVPKSHTNPRLHPTAQKGLTLKFPIEMNLLQEDYLLTIIPYRLDNYNQYNMTYFVVHVTFDSLCLSEGIMINSYVAGNIILHVK